jgi:lysophospholipase L1-like esterase
MRVLVFGDSVTQGFWDGEGGWVSRIRKISDKQEIERTNAHSPTIFNLGVSGNSSDDVASRIEAETDARLSESVAFIIAAGLNDSRTKAGLNFSDIDRYTKNLETILGKARNYSDKILFLGLTPCDERRTNPVSWGDSGYTNKRIREFNAVLLNFIQNNVGFVDIFVPFSTVQDQTDLLFDGLHPNDEGHQLIADLVWPRLLDLVA